MIVSIDVLAANASLNAISKLMNGGTIELLEKGTGNLLVVLGLSNPATRPAADGQIAFNTIRGGNAVRSGVAATGRIVGPSGAEVLVCDAGDESSDAVIRLNTTNLVVGLEVRLSSFRLAMP